MLETSNELLTHFSCKKCEPKAKENRKKYCCWWCVADLPKGVETVYCTFCGTKYKIKDAIKLTNENL